MPLMNRAQARQWSRAAAAVAAVFGTLPIVGRLLFGDWGFDGAWELAGALAILAAYLYLVGRRTYRPIPDSADLLDRAIQIARAGQVEDAIALLTEALRLSPRLWQAHQYRGELMLICRRAVEAREDFRAAIALMPDEPGLRMLLERAEAEIADKGDQENRPEHPDL